MGVCMAVELTEHEQLMLAEHKGVCNAEYYSNLVSWKYTKLVFWILALLITGLGGSYAYTRNTDQGLSLLKQDIVAVRKDIESNDRRHSDLVIRLDRIEDKLDKILNGNGKAVGGL